jgi:DnaD/phage-associated family protein
MARGRFVSKAIISDRGVHGLSSDTCRLAFTWLITTADKEGRTVGEPELLLAMLFPRRFDVTPEMMTGFIQEWTDAGFVVVYQASDGDQYLQFVNFEKHQVGLRKDREPKSDYESPDKCRIIAGSLREITAEMRVNDNVNDNDNDNVNENGNDKKNVPSAYSAYESNIGLITSFIKDDLIDLVDTYTDGWVVDAIKVAVQSNVRNLKYIKAILSRWKVEGKDAGKPKRGRQGAETLKEHDNRVIQELVAENTKGKFDAKGNRI